MSDHRSTKMYASVALMACGLLAMTGCSSGGVGSAVSEPTTDPSTTPAEVLGEAEWAKVVDAANAEGEVTVYGVLNTTTIDALPAAFAKDYPSIKLTYVRLSPSDLTARLDAEIASGNAGADVVDNLDHPTFDNYAAKGNLLPLAVPALGDAEYDREALQRTPYVANFGDTAYAWAWNSGSLPEGITSWQDYLDLDPTQIGATDPSIGPTVVAMYESIEQPETAGSGFLDELLAEDKPRIYAGSNPQVAAMSAGEVIASLPIPVPTIETVKATGAPVDYRVYPDAGSIPNEVAVVKSGKNPNAAQVYANWILSAEGQAVVSDGGFVAVREGVPQTVTIDGVTLKEFSQIPTDEFKAFNQRWTQLMAG